MAYRIEKVIKESGEWIVPHRVVDEKPLEDFVDRYNDCGKPKQIYDPKGKIRQCTSEPVVYGHDWEYAIGVNRSSGNRVLEWRRLAEFLLERDWEGASSHNLDKVHLSRTAYAEQLKRALEEGSVTLVGMEASVAVAALEKAIGGVHS